MTDTAPNPAAKVAELVSTANFGGTLVRPKNTGTMDPLALQKAEFFDRVRLMCDTGNPRFDVNRFPYQTRIIIEALFGLAGRRKAHVEFLKGSTSTKFYGAKLEELCRRLVDAGGSVRLVFGAREPDGTDLRTWQDLVRTTNGKVTAHALGVYDDTLYHYCLVGEDAYRLEFPHPKWDGPEVSDLEPERPARFSFKDDALGGRLKKYAEWVASRAQPV